MDHLKKLSLYEVNAYYIKYLSQYQDHLFYSDGEKVQRKYVGIILEINRYDYFEPNRSPCERFGSKEAATDRIRYEKGRRKQICNSGLQQQGEEMADKGVPDFRRNS